MALVGCLATASPAQTAAAGAEAEMAARTILYMTPRRRHFLVGFALGEKAVAAARRSDLPASTLALIAEARKYAEGRALRLEIRTKKDLEVAKRLAAIKMAS